MNKSWLLIGILIMVLIPIVSVRADISPGTLDTGFDTSTGANLDVYAIALQPNGKVIMGGDFTQVEATALTRIARLNADGSIDASFNPGSGPNSKVFSVVIQNDSKVLIGGDFTQVDGMAKNHITRLNADGSLDTSFDAGTGADNYVYAIALQKDGKVLIGGGFTQINGVTRNYIARLNADGSLDTSFDAGTGADNYVYTIALQKDGKVLIGGDFTQVDGKPRNYIARLNSDGSLDASFNPGIGGDSWLEVIVLQDDGKVLIGGDFTHVDGQPRNYIARLKDDGSLDTSFTTSANDKVYAVAIQSDFGVLIGGLFTQVDGVARNHIARLNENGSVDTSFNPGSGTSGWLADIVVQVDGKALIGGIFSQVDGTARGRIARLNADGSLNTGFNTSNDPDFWVVSAAVTEEGKIIIGGLFTHIGSTARNYVARLNADGSLDNSFNPPTGPNLWLEAVALQPDGRVLIGGWFTLVDGQPRSGIARLKTDGSLDPIFNPGSGTDGPVIAIALQDDSKILIGGAFTQVNGQSRNGIARLNSDGSLDTSFDPGSGANDQVRSIALQDNGKVLIGGYFTQVNGTNRNRVARLNTNGSLDTSFDSSSGADDFIESVVVQEDGKVLIGGNFTSVDGTARNHIARLNTAGSLDSSFDPGGGATGLVRTVALQPDGKVLIGGDFSMVGSTVRSHLARLKDDGSLDSGFNPGLIQDSTVFTVIPQFDGKILVGGDFKKIDGTTRMYLARVNGATPPKFTSAYPPSTHYGEVYTYTFTTNSYPSDTIFHVTSGSLPPGLSLNTTSGVLSGTPTTVGSYDFTISANNWVAPSSTYKVTFWVFKFNTTTTITSHIPNPSLVGQAVTVTYSTTADFGMPTGNVIVSGSAIEKCSATVADGKCSLTFTTKSTGTKMLYAYYEGDNIYNTSLSPDVPHSVLESWEDRINMHLPIIVR